MKNEQLTKQDSGLPSRLLICSAHAADFDAERFKRICPTCQGSGQILDDRAIGQEMRRLREAAKVSLRGIAAKLGFSAAYVSDLELGNRHWTDDKIQAYKKHLV
jgi:predicted transcriptional regulator